MDVSLPDFLVIGAQRSGSTWLHELLGTHERVYTPTRRKEIRYFSAYYDRGPDWYASFFPSENERGRYDAIGEVTPTYLYKAHVPERIRESLPAVRLMVILRNPADRAFSHYLMSVRSNNYRKSFEEALEENKGIYTYGLYGYWISRYLELFDRSRLLVLVYEDAVANVESTKARVASFLGTDPAGFPSEAGYRRVGGSFIPRARWAFAAGKTASRWLQRHDNDWLTRLAKRSGAVKLLGKQKETPRVADETRRKLLTRYLDDIGRLEQLLGLDLTVWKDGSVRNPARATSARMGDRPVEG